MKTKNKVAMNARRRGLMGGTLLGAMLCCSAIGAVTWTGGGAGNWSDANRWESGTVPTANDAVRLQNGANLVIDEDALLGQGGLIGDWTADGVWGLWGDSWNKGMGYTENPAYVREDGTLVLTDDAGSQRNFASISNRTFGIEDTFEAHFTYSASMLGRYADEQRAEGFGCYFGLHARHYDSSHVYAIPENAYGFSLKLWSTGGFSWVYNPDRPSSAEISGATMGINVGKPIDMIVRFERGLLTVSMRQGESLWSASRDISAGFANGLRRYFILSGGTNRDHLYAYQTISNFEGRSRFCGSVSHDGYLPFGTDKWQVNNGASVGIVNGNEIMMNKVTGAQGSIVCKKKLPTRRAFTVEFTERLSNVGSWGEGMSVALQPDSLSPSFSADRFSVKPVSADRGVSFGHKWWNPAFRWCSDGVNYVTSANAPNGIGKLADADYVFSIQHDGFGNIRATVKADGKTYADCQSYTQITNWSDGTYLGFLFGSIWNNSIECRVSSPRVLFADYGTETLADKLVVDADASATLTVATVAENDTAPMVRFPTVSFGSGSSLSVASTNGNVALSFENVNVDGVATLAMQNGARVSIGNLCFTGSAAGGLAVTGDVTFCSPLSVTVPAGWKAAKVSACLIDGTGMTGALPDVSAFNVVLSDGTVLQNSMLKKSGGKLTINFATGTLLCIR